MINFAVGPVQSPEEVLAIGAMQVPYFRTAEFSQVMLENEQMVKTLCKADESSRVVFLTGSGTAAMEASVMNVLTPADRVLIVNGGSFGERFKKICQIHHIAYDEIPLATGKSLTAQDLSRFDPALYTGFLVNVHETSTGVRYDMDLIRDFCSRNDLLLMVDAISSFLADDFDMAGSMADVMITGSQKALACPPGVSVVVLSERAVQRVMNNDPESFYFDLRSALRDAERGQTPFTPAVGTLLQIHARLKCICDAGGIENEVRRIAAQAKDFREKIGDLPFEIVSDSMSNAVTPLHPTTASAYDIFLTLKDEYDIWVCPNGGPLRDEIFRVGHIGALTAEDNTKLIDALKDMQRRGLI